MTAQPPNPVVVQRIALVWRALAHAYVDTQVQREMLQALQRRDLNGALNALPNMSDPNDARGAAMKANLVRVMADAEKKAFKLSADREYKKVGSGIRVAKAAKEPALNRFAEVPHDDQFIFDRSAELVADIGDEQRDNLRNVLAMRFDPDVRPENIIRDIKWVVGLTDRESAAVFNREEALRAVGVPERRIQATIQRYSDELHQKRAERIARTETVSIETQARDTAWKVAQSDGLIPDSAKKEWVANASACKDLCRKLDGIKVDLDGNWVSPVDGRKIKGPPAHPHCVPGDVSVSALRVLAAVKRRHDGDLIIIKTSFGLVLPCTANHPILTSRGWIAACELRPGDTLARDGGKIGVFAHDTDQHRETTASELFETFGRTSGVTPEEVKVSAPHFHGDGMGSEVAIVLADRDLRSQLRAAENLLSVETSFELRLRVARALTSLSGLYENVLGLLRASNSLMCFAGTPFAELGILSIGQQMGLAHSASSDTVLLQDTSNDGPTHAEALRDFLLRRARSIGPDDSFLRQLQSVRHDRVLSLDVQRVSIDVFNFETPVGYYFANGIATHNCECSTVLRAN